MTPKETIEAAAEIIAAVEKELTESEEGLAQTTHLRTAVKMLKMAARGLPGSAL